ncbi:unnamed protein product, partial [Gongylonema pulchrum]|uniref:DUF599 domain-containing protein n=1 Tax=Gongylonema pulchrum TaxID=637853 RepID=A0A183EHN7_9BILA
MPQIGLEPLDGVMALARHMAVPSLNSYIAMSLLLAVGSVFYAKFAYTKEEIDNRLRGINETTNSAIMTSVYLQQFYYLLLYPNLGWILINTICALLALVVKIAIRVTVGPVSAQESAVLGDRVGNFLVYKAVFLFGVLNSVEYEEAVAWILWFASLAAVAALQSILTYRLKY